MKIEERKVKIKVVREEDKIIGYLRLLNCSKIDLSYNERSKIVLMGSKGYMLRMNLEELKEFIDALTKYVKTCEE